MNFFAAVALYDISIKGFRINIFHHRSFVFCVLGSAGRAEPFKSRVGYGSDSMDEGDSKPLWPPSKASC